MPTTTTSSSPSSPPTSSSAYYHPKPKKKSMSTKVFSGEDDDAAAAAAMEEQEVVIAPSTSSSSSSTSGNNNNDNAAAAIANDANTSTATAVGQSNSTAGAAKLDITVMEKMGALQDMFDEYDAMYSPQPGRPAVASKATTARPRRGDDEEKKESSDANVNDVDDGDVSISTDDGVSGQAIVHASSLLSLGHNPAVDLDKHHQTIEGENDDGSVEVVPAKVVSKNKNKRDKNNKNNDVKRQSSSSSSQNGKKMVLPAAPTPQKQEKKKKQASTSLSSSTGAAAAAAANQRQSQKSSSLVKKNNKKRVVLDDDDDDNDKKNKKSAAAAGGLGTIAVATTVGLKNVPSTNANNKNTSPTSSSGAGTTSPTNSDLSSPEKVIDGGDDDHFESGDNAELLSKKKTGVGAGAGGRSCTSFLSSRRIMCALIVILVCLIGGAIVVSLRATNNLGYGTKGLIEAFHYTYEPSAAPSLAPSASPSLAPTVSHAPTTTPSASPSSVPSNLPSDMPSSSPSDQPSFSPSGVPTDLPSSSPSSSPTYAEFIVPTNPVPANPGRGYFNYDDDTQYGPRRWGNVNTNDHPLKELGPDGFGPLRGHLGFDTTQNFCGGPDRRQSPKHMKETTPCEADHEIRSRCGRLPVDSPRFERLILPHKLSLVMNRRPCTNVNPDDSSHPCEIDHPPVADYPRYSSRTTPFSDLLNFDIKIPGEHTMEDVEPFDAEIQMLHTHLDPDPDRTNSLAIPIRATEDGYNEEFQTVLNQFQEVYDANKAACARRRKRRMLRTSSSVHLDDDFDLATTDIPSPELLPANATLAERTLSYYNISSVHSGTPSLQRRLRQLNARNQYMRFDPYSSAFMRDVNFYRYDGSITEPPCMPITWWVVIEHMIISRDQLRQMEILLFTHVDANCRPTSVHNRDMKVTRPIYPKGEDREIQRCKEGDFESDVEKGKDPSKSGNICRA